MKSAERNKFIKSLLEDVDALEHLLVNNRFENNITRIGAEQEMIIVNQDDFRANMISNSIIEALDHPKWLDYELAKFNLEINLDPRELKNGCFTDMKQELDEKLMKIRKAAHQFDSDIILTGVLPTLQKQDMESHNITPKPRYKELLKAIDDELIGNAYELRFIGIDELLIRHNSPFLEAVNTSWQVHLQVSSDNFVKMYNIAQALAAPIMAIAANSSLVFGKRLWHESRIALFQQSIDIRTTHEHFRERSPRVSFGTGWLDESITDIFKEDIARFRVLLKKDISDSSLDNIAKEITPRLEALQLHNSTVYRWNRPCYGISDNGKPHLRIENRVLPAGPTTLDEIANTAFWIGSMLGMASEIDDIRIKMSFADARDNFGKAAKFGIDSNFTWFDDKKVSASELVLKTLLPLARKGLKANQVDQKDIDTYLNIIEERAKLHMTGARWLLRSYTALKDKTDKDEALTTISKSILENQTKENNPIHKWELPKLEKLSIHDPINQEVSHYMLTDIFTVQKYDIIELVAEMMDWKNIRYVPVEDRKGNLVGMISYRVIMRYLVKKDRHKLNEQTTVGDIMVTDPATIQENTTLNTAVTMMKDLKVGCLPIVRGKELVGLLTESDIINLWSRVSLGTTKKSRLVNKN